MGSALALALAGAHHGQRAVALGEHRVHRLGGAVVDVAVLRVEPALLCAQLVVHPLHRRLVRVRARGRVRARVRVRVRVRVRGRVRVRVRVRVSAASSP